MSVPTFIFSYQMQEGPRRKDKHMKAHISDLITKDKREERSGLRVDTNQQSEHSSCVKRSKIVRGEEV